MKKLVLVVSALLCFGLCACAAGKAGGASSYAGGTYAGKSPWGEEMQITVKKCDAGNLEIAYEEQADSGRRIVTTWSGPMKDDTSAEFTLSGKQGEDLEYDYKMRLEVKEGAVLVTFLDGQKTELSPEGGSGFHAAGALSDDQKTVTLTRR